MLDFQNPQIWWFLARASGIIAWALLTLTVVWGILLKTRILRGADNPEWLTATHRYISGLSLSMIAIHLFALWRDEYVQFGLTELFVPFASPWNPLAVALGIFAVYLIVAIQITALLSKRLPERLWKGIHLTSYITIVLVALHSGLAGSDVGAPWYTVVSLILITTSTLAGIIRLVIAGRPTPVRAAQVGATPVGATPVGARPVGGASASSAPRALVSQSGKARQAEQRFEATVTDKQVVGDRTTLLTLTPNDPTVLEPWEAGAHITLHLPIGLERQYSLAGDPADQDRLVLGVADTGQWGGGSGWIHHKLNVGDVLSCSGPRNHFPLRPSHHYQFIAAGIGITPIRAMLHSIPQGRQWSLLYIDSTRDTMLFVEELERFCGDRLTLWVTEERGQRPVLTEWVDNDADVYSCGPQSLLDELETVVEPSRLHLERFTPKTRERESEHESFTVVAARSGVTVTVADDESMLDALADAGVPLLASCKRGVCGSCEVNVVDGTPEHLDSVMSDADKDDLGIMYPCVSRSKTATLTVDA